MPEELLASLLLKESPIRRTAADGPDESGCPNNDSKFRHEETAAMRDFDPFRSVPMSFMRHSRRTDALATPAGCPLCIR
jgi:hypothetical protein